MTHRKCNVCNIVMLFDHDGCECTAKRKRKIRMTEDERNQYESTLWELEHDGYIDAPNLIRQQQAEIEALKEAIISENEACAQILLDSYDTTEPYEYINPDWLLTLVDLIDDRVGRVRT